MLKQEQLNRVGYSTWSSPFPSRVLQAFVTVKQVYKYQFVLHMSILFDTSLLHHALPLDIDVLAQEDSIKV